MGSDADATSIELLLGADHHAGAIKGVDSRPHPAAFSDAVLEVIIRDIEARAGTTCPWCLDPFAGIGKGVDALNAAGFPAIGVEIEPEWACWSPRVRVGDALDLPWATGMFDVVFTSPCLHQPHRVLTDDLRWVPVGDIEVGDCLLGFDEFGIGSTGRGMGARRRFQRSEVVRSIAKSVHCVRVILANGDELITTPEHPWLSYRYGYRGSRAEWTSSASLEGRWVQRLVEPWQQRRSYDAGWLAGMFDGEGSLSLGMHGTPKMSICQVDGPVMDRVERLMVEFGYDPNRIWRTGVPEHRQKISNIYVTGGFPGLLRALGELRPTRLMEKWATLDVRTRTVQAETVEVVAVEPAGRQDIQEIETTSATYFGEGYLHHNCYGNRMADSHDARDASERRTYKHKLGRDPNRESSATLQWGTEYRDFHRRAWREAIRMMRPPRDRKLGSDGAWFYLNISDHVRGRERQFVADWHVAVLLNAGLSLVRAVEIATPRMGFGENRDERVEAEQVYVFQMRRFDVHGRLL